MSQVYYSSIYHPQQGKLHLLTQGSAYRVYSPHTGYSKPLPPLQGVSYRPQPVQALSIAYSASSHRRLGCGVWVSEGNSELTRGTAKELKPSIRNLVPSGTNYSFGKIDAFKLRPHLLKVLKHLTVLDTPLMDSFELEGNKYRQEIYLYVDTQGTATQKLNELLRKLQAKDA